MFFKSKRKEAKDLLAAAEKVYNYRRDAIDPRDAALLLEYIDKLEQLIADAKIDSPEYVETEKKIEPLMRKCGGKIYPLTAWADYVDMIVVAGIVALSIRSFFLQPFKIPTNSMYPSFYGMTSEVHKDGDAPNLGERVFRRVFKAASNYSLKAKSDGDVFAEIYSPETANKNGGVFAFEWVPSREFFVIPSKSREYTFHTADGKQTVVVPAEFPLDSVIVEAFPEAGAKTLGQYLDAKYKKGEIFRNGDKLLVKLGSFKKGETILNFDLLGGDMLFVDRFTYNFRKPKVGEPFVFMTKYCDGLTRLNGGKPDDRYYIKRLVGEGGDELQVSGSTLLRNGKPAEGSVAFKANAEKLGNYCGYVADGALADGAKVKVPQKSYWAMGDNSENSLDSRYWGEVPQEAVVGKALIIFYPFTNRWGATK